MNDTRLPLVIWKHCIVPLLSFKSLVKLRCVSRWFRTQFAAREIPKIWQDVYSVGLFKTPELHLTTSRGVLCLPDCVQQLTLRTIGDVCVEGQLQTLDLGGEFVRYMFGWEKITVRSLPASLQILKIRYADFCVSTLTNLRELKIDNCNTDLSQLIFLKKLDILELPAKLPMLEEVAFVPYQDYVDLTHLPLKSVTLKDDGIYHGPTIVLPPVESLTIEIISNIEMDTSRLTSLQTINSFYPKLLVPTLTSLIIYNKVNVDLSVLVNLKKYKGYGTVRRAPLNIESLKSDIVDEDLSGYLRLRSLSHKNLVRKFPPNLVKLSTNQDVYVPVKYLCLSNKLVHIPDTVEVLKLIKIDTRVPRLPRLRKLIISNCVPPGVSSIDTLVLVGTTRKTLSQISVRKLKLVSSCIAEFPRKLRVFRYDEESRFPTMRGLDLI